MLDKKFSPSFPTDMQTECRVVDREGIRTTQTAISLLISDLLGKETWLSAGYFHTECVFEPLELRSRLVSALEALRDVGKLDQFTQNPLVLDDLSLRASAGLSVGWDSPFGPIKFDFSKILKKEEYDRTESFRFSTSTRF